MSEQTIINQYFSRHQYAVENVELSVGDDAAIVIPPVNKNLVITTDTLNEGIHFYPDCNPEYIGHKSLAVNLSDLAAMGATPLWATLSLSLPSIKHDWLEKFSDGFYNLANKYNLKLIGGDMVKGPLSVTIQAVGSVEKNCALLRSNGKIDDVIYVTGYLGDAAMGLNILQNNYLTGLSATDKDYFLQHLHMPIPRLDISEKIKAYAHAAIDISDGFLIDLQRVLTASDKGAEIILEKIPISNVLRKKISCENDLKKFLTGGEDYELIFTMGTNNKNKLERCFDDENIKMTEVGKIVEGSGITILNNGKISELPSIIGFDHFN